MVNPEHAYHPSDKEIEYLKSRLRTVYLALKLSCHDDWTIKEKLKEAELLLNSDIWDNTPG